MHRAASITDARRRARSVGMTTAMLFVLSFAAPVLAAPLDGAAIDAAPQRYIITLPEAPAGEIAQEVLGETLGLPVRVDERVAATLSFRIDGTYSPQELARELGYRLWNVDVALVEDRNHELALIPAFALPEAVAAGGQVVSPLALEGSEAQPVVASAASSAPPIVYGDRRMPAWPFTLAIGVVLGWLAAWAAPFATAWMRRRRAAAQATPLRLPAPTVDPLHREVADAEFLKGFDRL